MSGTLEDMDLIDGLMVAAVIAAERDGKVTVGAAASALGYNPQEYAAMRRQMVDIGRTFCLSLKSARIGSGRGAR